MRIVLATVGSLGDLHPYIAVARELRSRGADPVIATVPEYRADVEREGLAFAPVGPGFAAFGDYRELMQKIFEVPQGTGFIVREMVMRHLGTAYEDLARASEGADLLVSHPLTLVVPILAEQRALPWAATTLSPLSLLSTYDPPLLPGAEWLYGIRRLGRRPYALAFNVFRLIAHRWEAPLREFRRSLGLPPARGLALLEGQFSPYLNLALFDAVLAAPQPDWPRHLRVTGAPLHDGAGSTVAMDDRPLVFALGSSAVWIAGDFWQQAIEAARTLGRPAIFITGPVELGPLPAGMRAFAYLPYSQVFPRALAVIHQGGIGTLSQALRSGRPQLVVPFAFDQPDNARRAAALGVARVLPAKTASAGALAREIGRLIDDPGYATRATSTAGKLSETNGAASAAAALLQMRSC